VSARKPTKGKGGRLLKHELSKGKGKGKSKGKSSNSYKGKGKGNQYSGQSIVEKVTTPSLPYCDDVFQPVLVYKGKGKGGRRLGGL